MSIPKSKPSLWDGSTEAKPDDDLGPSPEERKRNRGGRHGRGCPGPIRRIRVRRSQRSDPNRSTGKSEASSSSQPGDQPASYIVADAEPANTEAREGVVGAPKSEQRSTGHTARSKPEWTQVNLRHLTPKTRENHQEQTVQSTHASHEVGFDTRIRANRSEIRERFEGSLPNPPHQSMTGLPVTPRAAMTTAMLCGDQRNEAKRRGVTTL